MTINTIIYTSCAKHSCQCDINTIINIQYNQCECVNDYVDDMNNEAWIVIESTVSDIAQVPQELHSNIFFFFFDGPV